MNSNHVIIAAADVRACSRSVGADLEAVRACHLLHVVDRHLLMVEDARGEARLDGGALEDLDEVIGDPGSGRCDDGDGDGGFDHREERQLETRVLPRRTPMNEFRSQMKK